MTPSEVLDFAGPDLGADFYLCGPAAFMDLIERVLLARGVDGEQVFVERFTVADEPADVPAGDAAGLPGAAVEAANEAGGTITIVLGGKRHSIARQPGLTLLQSARRAGLTPPFSCEAGNCATCIGQLTEGEVKMRVNNALDDDEIADGWVLTCQSEPVTPDVTVVYED